MTTRAMLVAAALVVLSACGGEEPKCVRMCEQQQALCAPGAPPKCAEATRRCWDACGREEEAKP